jgi:hypothetical protein
MQKSHEGVQPNLQKTEKRKRVCTSGGMSVQVSPHASGLAGYQLAQIRDQ